MIYRFSLLFLCFWLTSLVQAQYSSHENTNTSLLHAKGNTTYFVLTESEAFNRELKLAAEAYWDLTPFAFATKEDLPAYHGEQANYVYLAAMDPKTFYKGKRLYGLVFSPMYETEHLKEEVPYAYVPIDKVFYERKNKDLIFRLDDMLATLAKACKFYIEEDINNDHRFDNNISIERAFNAMACELSGKTIYVDKTYMLHKIPQVKPFVKGTGLEFVFLPQTKFEEMIASNQDVYYLISPSSNKRFLQIYNAAENRLLYTHVLEHTHLRDMVETLEELDAVLLRRAIKKACKRNG